MNALYRWLKQDSHGNSWQTDSIFWIHSHPHTQTKTVCFRLCVVTNRPTQHPMMPLMLNICVSGWKCFILLELLMSSFRWWLQPFSRVIYLSDTTLRFDARWGKAAAAIIVHLLSRIRWRFIRPSFFFFLYIRVFYRFVMGTTQTLDDFS